MVSNVENRRKMKIELFFEKLAVIILALSMLSCEKLLEADSDMKLKAEDHYSSIGEIYGAFMGLYSSFAKTAEKTIILSGLKGDLLKPTQNATEDYWRIYRYEANPDSEVSNAKEYYDVVINCNDFLTRVIKYNQEVPGDIPENVYKGMISQAICFKTWCLMTSGKLFGEAKFYTTPVGSDNEEGMYTLSLDELPAYLQTYMKGGEDGIDAFQTLDWTAVLGNTNSTLLCRNMSADALYGELALWAGKYQEAVDYLLKALSPDKDVYRNLSHYGNTSWSDIFTVEANSTSQFELISVITFDAYHRQEQQLKYYFSNEAPNVYYFAPTQKAIDYFENERMNASSGYRMGDTYRGNGTTYMQSGSDYLVTKYSLKVSASEFFSDAYVHIYRGGGVNLMLAEALAFLGNYDASLAVVNEGIANDYYKSGSWLEPFTNLYTTFSSGCKGVRGRVSLESLEPLDIFDECVTGADSLRAMSGQIADEVARELAYEGQRWFTLVRMGRNMGDTEFVADRVADKFDEGEVERYKAVLKNENNWFIK